MGANPAIAANVRHVAGDRGRLARLVLAGLVMLTLSVVFASLLLGPVSLRSGLVWDALWNAAAERQAQSADLERTRIILFEIRLPRTLLGLLVGGALAAAGAMMQGLFRNPLADPGLVGVSAGAGLAAVAIIVLGATALSPVADLLGIFALPLAAFAGGMATTVLLYRIATRHGRTSTATMLLAGIALGAMAGALTGIFVFISDDQQLRDLTFWSLGSLGGATWTKVVAAAPFIVPVFIVAPFIGVGLNGLLLGEAEAMHLGIDVQLLKRLAIFLVALATGASVAVSGVIGFVGIVVPHLLRLAIGPDHRYLLPCCMLLGGALLLGADLVARTVVAPAELPIGIVTAALGAPFFLWLLLRQRAFVMS